MLIPLTDLTAAAQLHTATQSTLSHCLSDLEVVVARPLFLHTRRFELTREGEVLLPKTIARLQEASPGIFVSEVGAAFAALRERRPNRSINVIIGTLGTRALGSGFATDTLLPDSIQFVARQRHRCSRQTSPSLAGPHQLLVASSSAGGGDARSLRRCVRGPALTSSGAICRGGIIHTRPASEKRQQLLSILVESEVQQYKPLGLRSVKLTPVIRFPDIGAIWDANQASPHSRRTSLRHFERSRAWERMRLREASLGAGPHTHLFMDPSDLFISLCRSQLT